MPSISTFVESQYEEESNKADAEIAMLKPTSVNHPHHFLCGGMISATHRSAFHHQKSFALDSDARARMASLIRSFGHVPREEIKPDISKEASIKRLLHIHSAWLEIVWSGGFADISLAVHELRW